MNEKGNKGEKNPPSFYFHLVEGSSLGGISVALKERRYITWWTWWRKSREREECTDEKGDNE